MCQYPIPRSTHTYAGRPHYGTAAEVREQRRVTFDAAYAANPARFCHRRPTPPELPTVAWINEPVEEKEEPGQKAS